MALIAPFRALRYNPAKIQHLEEVVTPPYDVIDSALQTALYEPAWDLTHGCSTSSHAQASTAP